MRLSLNLVLLVAVAAAATTSIGAAADLDPEQTLGLPHFSQAMPSKSVWPEMMGMVATAAKAQLEAELPAGSHVYLVPQGSMMTMDFRTDRVRIIYDKNTGLVDSPPRVG